MTKSNVKQDCSNPPECNNEKKATSIKLGLLTITAILVCSVVVPFQAGLAMSKINEVVELRNRLMGTNTIAPHPGYISAVFSEDQPKSTYTSREFADEPSNTVLLSSAPATQCSNKSLNSSDTEASDDAGLHQPAGQHLLIDMENVDPEFLSSPTRITQALVELVDSTSLTMLSYHCHGNQKGGFACVGVLLESHVSVHTWPATGDIAIDLFTCGSSSLLPIIEVIRSLFGAAAPGKDTPNIHWGHKRRGFPLEESSNVEEVYYYLTLGSMLPKKKHILEESTDLQRVSILDLYFDTSSPDRLVYLDSILQSRRYGDAAYHETLVHPALLTHENPKRVAIIGGGEGATLREVLKHKTVEEVVMIEIDERFVDICREHLPEWSSCGDIEGSRVASCFDDPRATMYYEDAVAWFIERYSNEENRKGESLFDVIIMDSLDPSSEVEFSDVLFGTSSLVEAVSLALGDEGILVAQVGEIDYSDEPAWAASDFEEDTNVLGTYIELLENAEFLSFTQYEEAHGGFSAPWEFLLATKAREARSAWFMNSAEMQLKIHQRVAQSTDGQTVLRYFDEATFMGYQFPSRLVETNFCRRYPEDCNGGHGFDPDKTDTPLSTFEVIVSKVANGGRGVATKKSIKKGSYLGIKSCVNGIFVPSKALATIHDASQSFEGHSRFWDTLFDGYIDGYGWLDNQEGLPSAGIEPSLFSFVNHGCNGTYNLGKPLRVTELTVDTNAEPDEFFTDEYDVYSPFNDRHFPAWSCSSFVALRDIEAGEELFDNYLVFGGSAPEDWKQNVQELQTVCSGGLGTISSYEAEAEE